MKRPAMWSPLLLLSSLSAVFMLLPGLDIQISETVRTWRGGWFDGGDVWTELI